MYHTQVSFFQPQAVSPVPSIKGNCLTFIVSCYIFPFIMIIISGNNYYRVRFLRQTFTMGNAFPAVIDYFHSLRCLNDPLKRRYYIRRIDLAGAFIPCIFLPGQITKYYNFRIFIQIKRQAPVFIFQKCNTFSCTFKCKGTVLFHL